MIVSGMLESSILVEKALQSLRNEDEITTLFDSVQQQGVSLNLKELSVSRKRKTPARYTGTGQKYFPPNASDNYKIK